MADVTVTGLTAARMKEIEGASIIDAELTPDYELVLYTKAGQAINVGVVRGATGPQGNPGTITKVAGKSDDGTGNVPLSAGDVGAFTKAEVTNAIGNATTPPGTIVMTGRTSAPAGWLMCTGGSYLKADYPALYSAIGNAFGAGSTTFNVPNLKGRVPLGLDSSQTGFDTMGETGGENRVVLSESQLPAHDHSLTNMSIQMTKSQSAWKTGAPSDTGSNGGKSVASGWNSARYDDAVQIRGNTDKAGSGASHNNLQPYIVLNFIIKI